jgi:hypothetical protein
VACLTDFVDAAREVLDRPGYAFSDAEVMENLRACRAASAVVDAVTLTFVAHLTARPGSVPGAPPGREAYRFLTEGLLVSGPQANRDIAATTTIVRAQVAVPQRVMATTAGRGARGFPRQDPTTGPRDRAAGQGRGTGPGTGIVRYGDSADPPTVRARRSWGHPVDRPALPGRTGHRDAANTSPSPRQPRVLADLTAT